MVEYAGSCQAPDGTRARVNRLDRDDLVPVAPAVPDWMAEAERAEALERAEAPEDAGPA